jgi:hypothetical protein
MYLLWHSGRELQLRRFLGQKILGLSRYSDYWLVKKHRMIKAWDDRV